MTEVLNIIKHHLKMVLKDKIGLLLLIVPLLPIFVAGFVMQIGTPTLQETIYLTTLDETPLTDRLVRLLELNGIDAEVVTQEELNQYIRDSVEQIYVDIQTNHLLQSLLEDKQEIKIYMIGQSEKAIMKMLVIERVLEEYDTLVKEHKEESRILQALDEQEQLKIEENLLKEEHYLNTIGGSVVGISSYLFIMIAYKNLSVMVREKQTKIYTRILTTPVTKRQYLIGHLLGATIIMLIQSILMVIGMALINIDTGMSIIEFLIVYALFGFTGITIGVLSYRCVKSVEDYTIIGVLGILMVTFTSGILFPIEILPEWVGSIASLVPTRWIARAYQEGQFNYLWIAVGINILLAMISVYIEKYKKEN